MQAISLNDVDGNYQEKTMNIPKPSPMKKLQVAEKPEPPKPVKKSFKKPRRNTPKPKTETLKNPQMKVFSWVHPDALFNEELHYVEAETREAAELLVTQRHHVLPVDLKEVKSYVWVCTGNNKRREIKARTKLEAGPICQEKYGFWPEHIEKKEFDRPEHLTHRPFAEHPVLQMMRNTDPKNNAGKGVK